MSDPIVIKKYENRRLYDTSESRYINLADVANMVREGQDVQVIEAKGGADVTRHVLTQIIVEGSKDPNQGPPVEFLRDFIQAGDQARRDFFQWYLKSAKDVYQRVHEGWQKGLSGAPSFGSMPKLGELWDPLGIGEQLRSTLSGAKSAPSEEPPEAADSDEPETELNAIKKRLEQLEKRLAGETE